MKKATYIFFLAIFVNIAHSQHAVNPSEMSSYNEEIRARAHYRVETKPAPDVDRSERDPLDNRKFWQKEHEKIAPVYRHENADWNGLSFGRYTQHSRLTNQKYTGNPHGGFNRNNDPFFRLGNLEADLDAFLSFEYNDNITQSRDNKISDFIIGAGGNIDINWLGLKTKLNESGISLNIGGGVQRYVDHPELARDSLIFNLDPNTFFSFDIMIGEVFINFHDRIWIQQAPSDVFSSDDIYSFDSLTNSAGIVAFYELNDKIDLSVGYERYDSFSLEDEFEFLDTSSDQFSFRIGMYPFASIIAGIEGSYTINNREDSFHNDSTGYNLGIYVHFLLTERTKLITNTGYQSLDFDDGGSIGDNNNLGDYYFNVGLTNEISQKMDHALFVGREATLGHASNYLTSEYARYSLRINTFNYSKLIINGFYETEEDSGGLEDEGIERYGIDVNYAYPITEYLNLSLSYQYASSESTETGRDYEQQIIRGDLRYFLSDQSSMGLGYRRWINKAEGDLSFTQNRIIFDIHYAF